MKNYKLIASLGLVVFVLLNTLKVSIAYSYYEIDPIGFIEKLCENKDRPELKCDGKCFLSMVTQTDEKSDSKPIIPFEEHTLFCYQYIFYTANSVEIQMKKVVFSYLNLYKFNLKHSFFHPPKV